MAFSSRVTSIIVLLCQTLAFPVFRSSGFTKAQSATVAPAPVRLCRARGKRVPKIQDGDTALAPCARAQPRPFHGRVCSSGSISDSAAARPRDSRTAAGAFMHQSRCAVNCSGFVFSYRRCHHTILGMQPQITMRKAPAELGRLRLPGRRGSIANSTSRFLNGLHRG